MISDLFTKLAAWTSTPTGLLVVTWLVLSLCTLVFKPRSPEQYAAAAARNPKWFWSRVAAFWQLVGSLGIDPLKVAISLVKIATGTVLPAEAMRRFGDPPPGAGDDRAPLDTSDSDPPNSGGRNRAAVVVAGAVLLCGCSQTPTAQDVKEGAQLGLSVLQKTCAVANAFFPVPAVMQACSVTEPYRKVFEQFLASTRAAGAAEPRPYLVTCEETDAGIVCVKPFVPADAGAR